MSVLQLFKNFITQIIHQLIERKQAEIRKVHPGLTYFSDAPKPPMNIKNIPGICKLIHFLGLICVLLGHFHAIATGRVYREGIF